MARTRATTVVAHVDAGDEGRAPHRTPGDDDFYRERGFTGRSYYGEPGYDEPVSRSTRVWRGDDGRTYCRHRDGTTGLLIGGAAGGAIGTGIAGRRGDRTLGAILGAIGGALLGREVERSAARCR
ncbi:MAG: glycine zipper 2TM domain-containing protein [Novosphingobium sp.]|nr:glycine zipper 2TM domain-containing protein [Novosphingobium sp.]